MGCILREQFSKYYLSFRSFTETKVMSLDLFKFEFRSKRNNDGVQTHAETSTPKSGHTVSQQNYDKSKRVRHFLPSWKTEFKWVDLTDDSLGMRCIVHQAHPQLADRKSSLFEGTASFRRDILVSHNESISHGKCQAAFHRQNVRRQHEQGAAVDHMQGPTDHQLHQMNQHERETMEGLFNTAYFISKEEAPFTVYPKLISLQLKNGAKWEPSTSQIMLVDGSPNLYMKMLCLTHLIN